MSEHGLDWNQQFLLTSDGAMLRRANDKASQAGGQSSYVIWIISCFQVKNRKCLVINLKENPNMCCGGYCRSLICWNLNSGMLKTHVSWHCIPWLKDSQQHVSLYIGTVLWSGQSVRLWNHVISGKPFPFTIIYFGQWSCDEVLFKSRAPISVPVSWNLYHWPTDGTFLGISLRTRQKKWV